MGETNWSETKEGMNTLSNNKKIDKKRLLLALEKTAIIEQACRTVNVPRSNYYRWRKEDPLFREKTDEAIEQSIGIITDLAVSMLIELIKTGHYSAIVFWLTRRDKAYAPISKEDFRAGEIDMPLSKEAQAILNRALNGGPRGRKESPPNLPSGITDNPTSNDYSKVSLQEGEIISPPVQNHGLLSLDEIQRMIDEYMRRAKEGF